MQARTQLKAIANTLGLIEFRSRLERRWAEFLTRLGYKWLYESRRLPGWIPDFLVWARPYSSTTEQAFDAMATEEAFLIEVKPGEPERYKQKIEAAKPDCDVVITRGGPERWYVHGYLYLSLGIMFHMKRRLWGPALMATCSKCNLLNLIHDKGCRSCGAPNRAQEPVKNVGEVLRLFRDHLREEDVLDEPPRIGDTPAWPF